ncbi:MAG: hypothetical protein K6E19_01075 [Lachnospiraceae bacterium]|nr:hypothetical protein [Lachnospiraceae bacterium]
MSRELVNIPDYDLLFVTNEKSKEEFLNERDEKVKKDGNYSHSISYLTDTKLEELGIDISDYVIVEYSDYIHAVIKADPTFEFGNTLQELMDYYGDN